MKRHLILVVLAAGLAVGAACTAASKPIPQSGKIEAPTSVPAVPVVVEKVTTTTRAPAVSTCDAVREALLTGQQAEINTAMAALQADRTADGTAREYADYYLHRDRTEPSMREMDVSLIRMYCS